MKYQQWTQKNTQSPLEQRINNNGMSGNIEFRGIKKNSEWVENLQLWWYSGNTQNIFFLVL